MYLQKFLGALARNRRLGLSGPMPKLDEQRRLTSRAREEFPRVVHQALGPLSISDVDGQCVALHHRLLPVVSCWLACEVYYTVGWVDFQASGASFHCEEEYLRQLLAGQHRVQRVRLHAWLTLPSLEIIDATLITTLVTGDIREQVAFSPLTCHPDELQGMAYQPMLLGTEFLYRARLLEVYQW